MFYLCEGENIYFFKMKEKEKIAEVAVAPVASPLKEKALDNWITNYSESFPAVEESESVVKKESSTRFDLKMGFFAACDENKLKLYEQKGYAYTLIKAEDIEDPFYH